MFLPFCLTVDPSIGKADTSLLSQQTLMELFRDGIPHLETVCGSPEYPKDLSDWYGVRFDATGNVVSIRWAFVGLEGTLALHFLPQSVEVLLMSTNKLSGSIDLTALPKSMRTLVLSRNQLTGSVNLTCFPRNMLNLNVSWNQLSGSLDVSRLPAGFRLFDVSNNQFLGVTDFSKIPTSLTSFDVSENANLSGELTRNHNTRCVATGTNVRVVSIN